jgi:hypothetical protein
MGQVMRGGALTARWPLQIDAVGVLKISDHVISTEESLVVSTSR